MPPHNPGLGPGEVVLWLREKTVLTEDPSSSQEPLPVAPAPGSNALFWIPQAPARSQVYIPLPSGCT